MQRSGVKVTVLSVPNSDIEPHPVGLRIRGSLHGVSVKTVSLKLSV